MGNNINKYVTSLVDILNNGVEIVTPKAGFLENLFSNSTYVAKKRLIKLKVSSKFFDLVETSTVIKELDAILTAAEKATKEITEAKTKADKEIAKSKEEAQKAIDELKKKTDTELYDKQTAFNREMEILQAEFKFEKAQAEAKLKREELLITGELKFKDASAAKNIEYTNNLIETEKKIFNKEVERLTIQFAKDKDNAEKALKQDLDSKLSIANAEIERLKTEANIAYTYDMGVVEKKVYAECYTKLKELQDALTNEGLKDDIISKLTADVEYFRSRFEDERTTSNAFGAKALDSALSTATKSVEAFGANLGKESKPVTVNVDAKSIKHKASKD